MEKPADNHHPIEETIRRRWSPRAFAETPVHNADLCSLFEAARWAASSMNEQPWVYIAATREDVETFEMLAGVLVPANYSWAKNASALALSIAKKTFSRDGLENPVARHDVGAASAQLTLQAMTLGLFVHQMGGFDKEKARDIFQIPDDYEPVTVLAIGYPGISETLPENLREREHAPRVRKSLPEFVFRGEWAKSASFLED
jgi:hypothetical protein